MSTAAGIIEEHDISSEIVDLVADPEWKEIVFESYMNQSRDSDYIEGTSKGVSNAQSHSAVRRGHLRVVAGG